MGEFLQSVWGFVLAIGILVTFHEYGHYWVARRVGVKVLKFSVGFGRPLWQRTAADGTVWQIAAIPLGGYVKMLDEREAPVAEEERDQAFNNQSVRDRMAIVAAGPVANFLLAILLYASVYALGQTAIKPIVGAVADNTPAARAGLVAGATIQSVDGKTVQTWDELRLSLLDAAMDDQQIILQTSQDGFSAQEIVLAVGSLSTEPALFFSGLGIAPPQVQLRPLIGQVVDGSPADDAGLQTGDEIQSLNATEISSWRALVEAIRQHPGERVLLQVQRNGAIFPMEVTLEAVDGHGRLGAGVAEQPELWQDFVFEYRLGPLQSLLAGAQQTLDVSWLTVKMLGRMILGDVSVRNLSGPLSIAEFAGVSASAGLVAFLGFLALISVSLGVLNLLPVPVLDGGHLLFYGIEALTGSPLSERVQQLGQSVGLALLLGLMSVALFNDINRLFG